MRFLTYAIIIALVFLLAIFCSGCAAVYPYTELGVGYKIDRTTSSVLIEGCDYVTLSPNHPRREYKRASCGGQNPTAHLNLGLEFDYDNRMWWKPDRVAFEHWSHFLDGTGGSRRETHKDEIVTYWKIGGRP